MKPIRASWPRVLAPGLAALLCATAAGAQTGVAPQEEQPPEVRSPVPLPVPELEEVEDDRLSFSYPVPAERGGGTVTGRAGSLESPAPQQVVLSDRVEVGYRDMVVQADRVELDLEVNQVRASGNVILDQGPRRVTAETMEFDLDTETGMLYEATGYVDPDFYFRGKTVEKVDEDTYIVRNGVFTSCSDEVPDWSFRVARARVTLGGYARALHTAMRIKKLPFFYLPYILWPVKEERTSGFLIPKIGFSDHRGTEVGLAYYQTFGDSYDATLDLDLYEKLFTGYGLEFRYRPTGGTSGKLRAYRVDERDTDGSEQRIDFLHDSRDLPGGLRGVVRIQDYSDFSFFSQQFERELSSITRRNLYSSAYLTGSWGAHSLNVLVDQRESFRGEETTSQRQLPELEYRLRTVQIGPTPFYFSLRSSAHVFDVEPATAETYQYERSDWIPELSFPFSRLPWLSMTASVRERFTWYSDSLDPEDTTQFSGESLTRSVPSGDLEIVGPSFSRIYDREAGSFARFKHVVEPQITYTYTDEVDVADQERTPLFDEVDRLGVARNVVRVAVVNRLLAKPKLPRELREKLEAERAKAEAEARAEGTADTDEEPGDEEIDLSEPIFEDPAEAPIAPSVTEQLDREADMESGLTGAVGAFDTLSEQAAALAATSPREILSFTVAQARSLDDDCPLERPSGFGFTCPFVFPQEPEEGEPLPEADLWGPVAANLRFNPSSRVSFDTQVNYSPLFSNLISTSISGGLGFGRYAQHSVGLTWYKAFNDEEGETTSDQIRLRFGIELWPERLRLGANINYNVLGFGPDLAEHLQSQSYMLSYTGQCYGFDLTYFERQISGEPISEIRFALSLKNVGTLLDLNTGLRGSY